ncbi:MAG: hypothetical protein HC836_12545 [Richelia sp. RM2_1_2]|nr:hypothetical protein [Richelia sp. RM2_1_2]
MSDNKKQSKAVDAVKDQIFTILLLMLGGFLMIISLFLMSYITNKFSEWNINTLMDEAELSVKIQEDLAIFRSEIGANRVSIVLFHNGTNMGNGVPFKKMSIIYESIGVGISPKREHFQNIPIFYFSTMLKEILENGKPILLDVEAEDDHWALFLKDFGSGYVVQEKMMNGSNIIGFIMADFNNKKEFSEEDLIYFSKKTKQFSFKLTFKELNASNRNDY